MLNPNIGSGGISDRPRDLYFLESRLLAVLPALEASKNALERLRSLYDPETRIWTASEKARRFVEQVDAYSGRVQAYTSRLHVLLRKRESTAHLLEQTISWSQQRAAQDQNDLLTNLTKSAVDDSVTIRVITVITLVYLSFTVVAVCILPKNNVGGSRQADDGYRRSWIPPSSRRISQGTYTSRPSSGSTL